MWQFDQPGSYISTFNLFGFGRWVGGENDSTYVQNIKSFTDTSLTVGWVHYKRNALLDKTTNRFLHLTFILVASAGTAR